MLGCHAGPHRPPSLTLPCLSAPTPLPPQYTVNFLNLLIDQNRIEALDEICESFEKSYCALTDTQVGVGCWGTGIWEIVVSSTGLVAGCGAVWECAALPGCAVHCGRSGREQERSCSTACSRKGRLSGTAGQ